MAKSKVSQKDTSRQESIKHFKFGIVSWDLFDNFWNSIARFIENIDFLVDAGFLTDKREMSLNMISDQIDEAKGVMAEIWGKAKDERSEAIEAVGVEV